MSLLSKPSLPSKLVTARVGQVTGKKQRGTVCALCYLRLALQTKVLISQRYCSGNQEIPTFYGTHYRVVMCARWIWYAPSLAFCSKSSV